MEKEQTYNSGDECPDAELESNAQITKYLSSIVLNNNRKIVDKHIQRLEGVQQQTIINTPPSENADYQADTAVFIESRKINSAALLIRQIDLAKAVNNSLDSSI